LPSGGLLAAIPKLVPDFALLLWMRNRLTLAFFFIYILLIACQTDKDPSNDTDLPLQDEAIIITDPENSPDAIFLAWQQAMDLGRFNDAIKWSSPETEAWVNTLQKLSTTAEISDKSSLSRIESIQCNLFGDTAICMFAEVREDMLQLDSVRLIRINGNWKVDLEDPDRLKQTETND
jgi:hypothetical protein